MRSKLGTTMSCKQCMEVFLKLQERIEFAGLDMHKNFGLPTPDPSMVQLAQLAHVLRDKTNYNAFNYNKMHLLCYPH